jgi:hypothetical protein
VDNNLTLEGLRLIYQRNHKSDKSAAAPGVTAPGGTAL